MSKTRLLLYGAYGYTGRLTAELAAAKKLDVVLAGRNKDALAGLGDPLGLPTRPVGLNDASQLSQAMSDIACVVHMAGPFAATSDPMLSACVQASPDTLGQGGLSGGGVTLDRDRVSIAIQAASSGSRRVCDSSHGVIARKLADVDTCYSYRQSRALFRETGVLVEA